MFPSSTRRLAARPALAACSLVLSCAAAAPACAQVVSAYGGLVHSPDVGHNRSRTFALDYTAPVDRHLSWSLLYLNEGHLDGHHRDGYGAQLWLRTAPLAHGLVLSAGAGPYYHFDTANRTRAPATEYANRHGWGLAYGLAASLPLSGPWSAELKLTRVSAHDRFNTNVALIGIGYRLDARPDSARGASLAGTRRDHEITVLLGQTILNSFDSQRDNSASVEYRQTLSPHLEWTATWLNEGEPGLISRQGVSLQGWLVRSALSDKLRLGIGAGPYLAHDRRHGRITGESERQVAGLVSLTARYRLTERWHARATWHRVLADYHRDTDVLLVGAGFSF